MTKRDDARGADLSLAGKKLVVRESEDSRGNSDYKGVYMIHRFLPLLVLGLCIFTRFASAQASSATDYASVTSSTGAAIPSARVTPNHVDAVAIITEKINGFGAAMSGFFGIGHCTFGIADQHLEPAGAHGSTGNPLYQREGVETQLSRRSQ